MAAMGDNKKRYESISGVRVVMSVWVMLLHISVLITALTRDPSEALSFHSLPWMNAARHYGCQVDGQCQEALC